MPPREIRILPRGNWMDKSGKVVQPHTPHFMKQIDTGGRRPTRLDLAKWVVSRDNPLTARVVVNRLWKQYYGIGLSKLLIDMGSRGEVPPNQELLDWLAIEFMDNGWDMKHMIRLMVTTSAYRQSSLPRPEVDAIDPDNRLVAQQSRFRLEAEQIRDNALAVSGLLVNKLGGDIVQAVSAGEVLFGAQLSRSAITRHRRARTNSAGPFTCIGSGSSCIRSCWRSTRRRAKSARPSGRFPARRRRRWCCSTIRRSWKRRGRWRQEFWRSAPADDEQANSLGLAAGARPRRRAGRGERAREAAQQTSQTVHGR